MDCNFFIIRRMKSDYIALKYEIENINHQFYYRYIMIMVEKKYKNPVRTMGIKAGIRI